MANKFGSIHRANNSSWFCRDNIPIIINIIVIIIIVVVVAVVI